MKIIIIPNMPVMSGRHYCIAKELVRQGHTVEYFMWAQPYGMNRKALVKHLFTSLISKSYDYEEFTVHTSRRLPYFWPVLNGFIFKAQLRKLFKSSSADVIITESYTNETEVPKELPYIYDLADNYAGPAEVYGGPLYKLAFKLLGVRRVMKNHCANAKAVTVVSQALYEYALPHSKTVVKIPNGVESQYIKAVTKKARNPHSLVYATGFGVWSRAIETLEAVVELRLEFPHIELTLIGDGTEIPRIKKFIQEHSAQDYIRLSGYVYDRKELYELMSQSAIGLNISDKNTWRDASHPMKVMDYCALGLTVVSTNLREVEALNFENIVFLSDKPGHGLKNAIKLALTYRGDTEKISRRVLHYYSWEKLTGVFLAIMQHEVGSQ
jgi:glycosyltransferase involved in cell wall biosynthesis